MVLNVHRNHKAYQGQGEGWKRGMEVAEEGDYIPMMQNICLIIHFPNSQSGSCMAMQENTYIYIYTIAQEVNYVCFLNSCDLR